MSGVGNSRPPGFRCVLEPTQLIQMAKLPGVAYPWHKTSFRVCACVGLSSDTLLLTKIDQSKATLPDDFPQPPFLLISVY